ncbi:MULTISPECIES: hemolysin family protein [Sphingopyxis]|jgi:CBS domain containing-hemolysin-like protein|uniref:CBS domain-containing protein n=1 Tax=Sphingopyxis terrae subsp. ummariensis TaxID=429001 RepID=A0A1Y6FMW0_9SPHN|nr:MULTISPECIES: hemolysin family protein [Sphingopyxis]OJW26473.1 MAG: magnesium/cobalt efflux protein [Sphingopyxis sp. 65-8]KTE74035.1 magnesium/cobalt efflux protein [Sphingopyxis sp. A083]MBD3747240.1 HlyC/CorC family transporter [Sphingopyxis terrae]MBN8805049.1 HlyC/CorC family transporter [Sphingopyxis terrae]MDX8357541.1 hemolysin family protein [Sphingopyxis terrae]
MPDEQGSSTRSEEDSRSGLWAGIRTLLFGGNSEPSLREQIEEVIDEAEEEGAERRGSSIVGDLSPIERKMLRNLLHFGEQTVDDVAVPRGEIIAISESASFEEIVAIFADAGHSRLPVYRETLDEVVGMIHVKDVFAVLAEGRTPPPLLDLLRQPLYVPQSMGVLDLLAEMRAKRTHLAIVIDEYSGTDGLVTIEDLVEEIVGEIEDEHDDEPTALFVPDADGCWDADARAELDDIGEVIDPRLAEVDEDVDTLGGLAAVLAGHVPAVGEVLHHPSGWRIEITEADEKRVHRLRLHPPVVVDLEASADRGADF